MLFPRRSSWRRPELRRVLAVGTAAVLATGLGLAAPGVAGEPGSQPATPTDNAHTLGIQEITLITGDRVTYEQFNDGRYAITVDAGERAAEVSFDTLEYDGQAYVLPSDAAALIPDVLDRELFNITKLVEYGYTDQTSMIVQYAEDAPTFTRASLSNGARLDSINAVSTTVADGAWWAQFASDPAGPATQTASAPTGVERVWLNEKVKADLADSVPMIGAPEAWQAGFDGTGTTVAVLDTGIDDSHPDLADQVVMAENFTEEDDASDGHGHGTHVAGTVAGTGADSDGEYVGVAPGAELMNGKVLDSSGNGTVESVVAGMEWAAQQGADVINMSLGTDPTDGTDPIAQAVNSLTAEHDVLFVASAGNDGPDSYAVGSPGAADASLTVGAVSKQGMLAPFSSRGPRLGDDAIKPDITAPGVAIMAAALGSGYRSSQGTSMAAPHVAGAAAILAQQDPDLSAPDLKAVLASTGTPHPDLDVYEQGGGVVDVPGALNADILANPTPLNLGLHEWPHDDADPVQTEVSFTNRSDEPITLDLSFDVSGAGQQPSDEMLSVSPDTVTVPAGDSESVTVTLDVTEGETGLYGGYLITETDGQIVNRIPTGFHKEPETHQLTVEGIARDGNPAAGSSSFHIVDVEDMRRYAETEITFEDGTATLRVPDGTYAIMGMIYTHRADFPGGAGDLLHRTEQVWVAEPEVTINEDTSLVLDARNASRVTVETPGYDSKVRTNTHDHHSVRYYRSSAAGGVFQFNSFANYAWPIYATATDPVELGDAALMSRKRLSAPPDLLASVVAPEQLDLDPLMMVQSPALDGEIEAPLIDVGEGRPEDYEGLDAEGAVVLTVNGGINNGTKARNAMNAGAAAVLVRNNVPGALYAGAGGAPLPTLSLSQAEGDALIALLDNGEVTVNLFGDPAAPVLFDLVMVEDGHISDDLTFVADPAELATLEKSYHADADGSQFTGRHFFWPHGGGSSVGIEYVDAPQQRTEYLVPGETIYRGTKTISFPHASMEGSHKQYEPGEQHDVTWGKQPFTPGIRTSDINYDVNPTVRDGDMLQTDIREWVDAYGNGNWGFNSPAIDTTSFRVFTDGELTSQSERAIGSFPLSSDPAEYRLELDVTRDAAWWHTSTSTNTAWTVQSDGTTDQPVSLPLLFVDYDVDLDLFNTAKGPRDRRGPALLDLHVNHQETADSRPIAGAEVAVSYDDGDTWRTRPTVDLGDGHYRVVLDERDSGDSTGFASLRVQAWDVDDNRIEQEITRAWRMPAR